jgi:Cysteine-rich CWC
MKPLPNHQCPLCGKSNQCAPATAGDFAVECWCTGVVISQEALDRVPEALRGKACLCPRCASGAFSGPAAT